MNVDWKGSRCILCLESRQLSCEHIIPLSIGGKLTSSILCRNCNSRLGSEIEAYLRSDPTVRLAVNQLKDCIPSLATELEENQPFIICGGSGEEAAYVKNGVVRVHERKAEDGSLIQPSDKARTTVSNILKKSGVSPLEIHAALNKLDNSEPNNKIEIYPGLETITWTGEKAKLNLADSEITTPLVPLKIAYEFLACHLGEAIYDEAPQFEELRSALRTSDSSSTCFRVERLTAKDFKPFHGICHEGNAPYTKVQIRLFGFLAFRVHFVRIAANGPRFVYTHDLRTGMEDVSELTNHAA